MTEILLDEKQPTREHNSARLDTLDKETYCLAVENQLSNIPTDIQTIAEIESAIDQVTDALLTSFLKQGKMVRTKEHRHKTWWNEDELQPKIRERNRARKWMILSGTYEAAQCYWEWNNHVKFFISELKKKHWREFLAKTQGGLTFKAFKYTQAQGPSIVAPLYRQD